MTNLISLLVLGTKIFFSRTNWQCSFGSVDGTVLRIFCPKINQNIVYSGHKEHTASSFKVWLFLMVSLVTLVAPMWVNGMILHVIQVWTALEFKEISIGITISTSAFMTIQHTPHRFIFKPHFPDKILHLTQ